MKSVEVVAAVILSQGKVLCVQRGSSKFEYVSKKWEFPGGKIESGETHQGALGREIREELSLEIIVGDHVLTVDHNYPDFRIVMHAYLCEVKGGAPKLSEHLALEWRTPKDLWDLDWAAADLPIVAELESHG